MSRLGQGAIGGVRTSVPPRSCHGLAADVAGSAASTNKAAAAQSGGGAALMLAEGRRPGAGGWSMLARRG